VDGVGGGSWTCDAICGGRPAHKSNVKDDDRHDEGCSSCGARVRTVSEESRVCDADALAEAVAAAAACSISTSIS